jgi:hypothetical protein
MDIFLNGHFFSSIMFSLARLHIIFCRFERNNRNWQSFEMVQNDDKKLDRVSRLRQDNAAKHFFQMSF